MISYAPGPKGHPLLGSLRPFAKDQLGFFEQLAKDHGDVAHFRIGPVHAHLLSHPDLVREVLIDDAKSYHKAAQTNGLIRRFLGDSMLTLEAEPQRRQRKLSAPALGHKRLATYGEAMVDCTLHRIAQWTPGSELDAVAEMQALAVHVVTKTLVGLDRGDVADRIAHDMDELGACFFGLLTSPVPWPEWVPTSLNRRMRRARENVDRVLLGLIAERRADPRDRNDLLSMLLHATEDGSQLTDASCSPS
jgi:cytochrome P450